MSEETIGSALRIQRTRLGIDQRDAAERIGMSRTTYSSYERDTQRPSVDVLPAIAGFLGVSIDDVLALFGASAIAAARTALDRLNLSGSVGGSATMASEGIVPSHEVPAPQVFAASDSVDSRISNNGGGYADDDTDSSPGHPSVSMVTTGKPDVKVDDEGDKGKKKKKKSKRGKLETPAFATHV